MATAKFSPQKKVRGPMTLLAGAICEWVLIFLIFVDAAFSYIIRRFAEYCELPTQCILCSRIDTPSGKRKPEYYNALFCRSHKEEISSLASCHAHGKLTDVRELCEECYMPMYAKLNSGSYIVGKLEKDIEKHSVQSLVLHKKILPNSSAPRICSWGANSNAQTFLQLTPAGMGASKANVKPPLPRVQGRSRFSRKNSFKKLSDTPASPPLEGESLSEALSHVGYTELKFTSDTESEMNFSDEDGSAISVLGRNDKNLEHDSHYAAETLLELQTDDSVLEKHSNQNFEEVTSLLDQSMELETHKPIPTHGLEELNWEKPHPKTDITVKSHDEDDMTLARESINSTVLTYGDVPCFLNEISSTNSSATGSPKFEDTLSVIQQSAPEQDDSLNVDESTSDLKHVKALASLERNDSSLKLKERVSLPSVSTKFGDTKSIIQQSAPEKDDFLDVDESSSDLNHVKALASLERNDSSLKLKERVSLPSVSTKLGDNKSVTQHSSPEQEDSQNLGESSSDFNHVKVLASLERNDSSLKVKERVSLPTVSIKFEDNKSVIQHSAPEQDESQNVGESSSDFNHVKALASLERNDSSLKLKERVSLPSVSTNFEDNKSAIQQSAPEQDEIQNIDDPNSDGNHVQDLPSLERNASSVKFEERVSLSDLEGEISLDMLKRQIEHDRKCMNDLYKELEEERNASTIAANEAMAMITRLQEEKAQLHMEALQYLRMMDEQAEYDMEALQKANDDLTEKEKDLQDLEYELELYRNNIHGGSPIHDLRTENISTMAENRTLDSCLRQSESTMAKIRTLDSCLRQSESTMAENRTLDSCLRQSESTMAEIRTLDSCLRQSESTMAENRTLDSCLRQNESSICKSSSSVSTEMSIDEADEVSGNCRSPVSNLDEEKLYLVEYLKQLEKRIHHVSTSGREVNMETLENEIENLKGRLKDFCHNTWNIFRT